MRLGLSKRFRCAFALLSVHCSLRTAHCALPLSKYESKSRTKALPIHLQTKNVAPRCRTWYLKIVVSEDLLRSETKRNESLMDLLWRTGKEKGNEKEDDTQMYML